jgi:hypothetical protein
MMRKVVLSLLVGAAMSPVLFAPGCGGSSSSPDGGRDAKDASDGRAGTGGGNAGTTGSAGVTGGAGMDAAAGTNGTDAAAGGDGGVTDAPTDMATPTDTAQPDLRADGSMAKSWKFDLNTDGWALSRYGSTPNGMPDAADNLAKLSTLGWDMGNDAAGSATSGSLKGTVPFTKVGDRIDFQAFSQATAKYDWTGYTVSAKVKLVSGGNIAAGCPLYAWLYASQAPDYNTPLGPKVALQTGAWVTLNFDVSSAAFNVKAVNQLGIQIDTGAACGGGGTGDAGVGDAADGSVDADLLADAGLDGAVDAVVVVPPTATTATILIDDVIVSVK